MANISSIGGNPIVPGAVQNNSVTDAMLVQTGGVLSMVDDISTLSDTDLLNGIEWEVGSITTTNWGNLAASNRIRTVGYISVKNYPSINFVVANGYKFVTDWYDASKVGLSQTSKNKQGMWQTASAVMEVPSNAAYLRLLIADTNDGTASTDYSQHLDATGALVIVASIADIQESIAPPDINDYNNLDLGWTIGTLDSNNGKEMSSTTRVRSTYIRVGRGTTLSISDTSTYSYLYYMYELDGTFIIDTTWRTADVTLDRDYLIRILVRYTSNATITSDELASVAEQMTISYGIPFSVLSDSGLSSSGAVPIYDIEANVTKKQQASIIKQKKTTAESWGQCDLKMMYFTDVHGDATRTARMTELVNAWGTGYFDAAVCGGDIAQAIASEDVSWYYSATDDLDVPLLNVVGNHDAWADLTGELAAPTDVYEKFVAPIAAGSSIMQPADAASNGYNYYYKDFNSKVRVVVLDCMYWDATQLSWFEGVLADAKTNGLHVLACSHAAFPLANMEKVDCLWSKSGVNTDSTRLNIAAAGAVATFIDNGGTFIAWIVGHQHGDYVHTLPDYENQYVINLASFANRAGWLLKSTDAASYNYDCLTYITIDTTYKTLRLLRIGANIDIFGTKYDGLVINYEDNSLVSSW